MTEYILEKNDQSIIIKTTLEESRLIEIIEQIKEQDYYNEAYFIQVVETLEEKLNKCRCKYEFIDPDDLTIITIHDNTFN